MGNTSNKFSPEVRSRAVRLVPEHAHASGWAAARRDAALKPEIARVFAQNFEVYGMRHARSTM